MACFDGTVSELREIRLSGQVISGWTTHHSPVGDGGTIPPSWQHVGAETDPAHATSYAFVYLNSHREQYMTSPYFFSVLYQCVAMFRGGHFRPDFKADKKRNCIPSSVVSGAQSRTTLRKRC